MHIIGTGGHADMIESILKPLGMVVAKEDYLPGNDITISMNVIIGIGDNEVRRKIAEYLDLPYGQAISSNATIAEGVEIGEGTVIMPGAIINTSCRIGKHCIINTNASIDHGCIIGDFVSVGPGATICGGCHIKMGASIGANATVIPCRTVRPWHKIKAGELVT